MVKAPAQAQSPFSENHAGSPKTTEVSICRLDRDTEYDGASERITREITRGPADKRHVAHSGGLRLCGPVARSPRLEVGSAASLC